MAKLIPIFFIVLLLIAFNLKAEEKTEASLFQKASQEIQQPENISVLTQQESGVIQLSDDYNLGKEKKSSFFTAFKIQQLTHFGKGFVGETSSYSFSEMGSTVRPSLSLGYLSQHYAMTNFTIRYGVQADVGYSAQETNLPTATGEHVFGRLQYLDLAVRPVLAFPWQSFQKLSTKIYAEYGQAQLAMASRSSLARFSKNISFYGYGIGLDYDFNRNWAMELEYFERRPFSIDADWSFASANTQLGVQYQW